MLDEIAGSIEDEGLPGCRAAREAREPRLGLNENGEHGPELHNLPLMV